jgi:hypothetical protein
MTDEERERILRDLPPLEDRLTRWKREADEAEAARARYREQTAAAEVNAQRSMVIEVCDQRIAAALAAALEGVEERRIKVLNAVGDVMYAELAKERKRSDRVLAKAVRELREEFVSKQHEAGPLIRRIG